MSLSQAAVAALQHSRGRLNARFEIAAQRWPHLDGDEVLTTLRDVVLPAAEATADEVPLHEVVEALHAVAVGLVARGLLGDTPRRPEVHALWTDHLPRLGPLLSRAPTRLAVALTNAVHTLATEPGGDATDWCDRLVSLADTCDDPEALLAAGKVLAWRLGAAHWRQGAITAWRSLAAPLAAVTLDVPAADLETVSVRLDQRWGPLHGEQPPLVVGPETGGFEGFGGPFPSPPEVAAYDDVLYARCGDQWWRLCADRYGATLHPTPPPTSGSETVGPWRLDRTRRVIRGDDALDGAAPIDVTSRASNDHTLAVTSARSHRIAIFGATHP